MPGAVVDANELQEFTIAAQKKMGGNPHVRQSGEIGMRPKFERIGEKLLDFRTAEAFRWQTDRMQHDQRNSGSGRASAEIWARNPARRRAPAA